MKKINDLKEGEISQNLNFILKQRGSKERYASFDYCFNYFQDFRDKGKTRELKSVENMQLSCMHLGFYLASWGMYRGSSFLLQKSVKVYEELIKYIADECNDLWDIDVNNYDAENIKKLTECAERIKAILKNHKPERAEWDTLVTKIMLGVFGNVPAFDTYFKKGSDLGTFGKHALEEVYRFYIKNEKEINDFIKSKDKEFITFEYDTGEQTGRLYTKAKIVDMIFFQKGFSEAELEGMVSAARKLLREDSERISPELKLAVEEKIAKAEEIIKSADVSAMKEIADELSGEISEIKKTIKRKK